MPPLYPGRHTTDMYIT